MTGRSNQLLVYYANIVIFVTLSLIFLGALVKSHEAGLSVPDWPSSYGYNMFLFPYSQWVGNIFYEHSHRLLASLVGALTIILAIWISYTETHHFTRLLGWLAVGMVVLQGTFGGLTVLLRLPDIVSICHGVLAQTFLLVLIWIKFLLTQNLLTQNTVNSNQETGTKLTSLKLTKLQMITIAALYLQLILGAMTRHAEAGLAVPDFPTMGGAYLPIVTDGMIENINSLRNNLQLGSVNSWQVIVHLLHRFWALGIIVVLSIFSITSIKRLCPSLPIYQKMFKDSNIGLITLVLTLQFCLGILTVISIRHPWIASLHLLFGAILLASCFQQILRDAYSR
jgi:cytochrome c oxidase assembly protein subunit 15